MLKKAVEFLVWGQKRKGKIEMLQIYEIMKEEKSNKDACVE